MGYKKIDEVELIDNNGLSVKLRLNSRWSENQAEWTPICWRTVRPISGTNRQRYKLGDGSFWHITVDLAIELMELALHKGLLDTRYDDKYDRLGGGNFTYSEYSLKNNMKEFLEICLPGEEKKWPQDTIFLIAEEPKGYWRKVMIASKQKNKVTFRSLTRCSSYRLKVKLANNTDWDLDNSMMDCDTAVMRKFYSSLKTYVI